MYYANRVSVIYLKFLPLQLFQIVTFLNCVGPLTIVVCTFETFSTGCYKYCQKHMKVQVTEKTIADCRGVVGITGLYSQNMIL